eukprot:12925810-Prorocentrum_lima.AAC.1
MRRPSDPAAPGTSVETPAEEASAQPGEGTAEPLALFGSVKLHGLSARADLNGTFGAVCGPWLDERWPVR